MKATSVPLSDQQKGPPRRVRIFEQGAPNAVGKLVIIPPNCSFSEFLLMCGKKLGVKALQGDVETKENKKKKQKKKQKKENICLIVLFKCFSMTHVR